jgi:hypothetical protein
MSLPPEQPKKSRRSSIELDAPTDVNYNVAWEHTEETQNQLETAGSVFGLVAEQYVDLYKEAMGDKEKSIQIVNGSVGIGQVRC